MAINLSRYDGPPALTKYDIQETKIEVVLFYNEMRPQSKQCNLQSLLLGGDAGGRGSNSSDNNTWPKTFRRSPERLCPNYHSQLDWFQYKLL